MDTRVALDHGTVLRLYNSNGSLVTYTIKNELARGGSCIVYDASYMNNTGRMKAVRIKECYPFELTLSRALSGFLCPCSADIERFETEKERMREAFNLSNELFDVNGLTN